MTDIAYRCHNCGRVHEVESIRENLLLDLRTAASYQPSVRRGMLDARDRFLRWRMNWGLARALWPPVSASSAPGLRPSPVACRAAAGGSDVRPGGIRLYPAPVADRLAPDSMESSPGTDVES
jgi:hypothetical protein